MTQNGCVFSSAGFIALVRQSICQRLIADCRGAGKRTFNVELTGRCAALSRSVRWSAGLAGRYRVGADHYRCPFIAETMDFFKSVAARSHSSRSATVMFIDSGKASGTFGFA